MLKIGYMEDRYVVDTCAVISYFAKYFENCDISVSEEALGIIDLGFVNKSAKLIFPSTVFIEIFAKWCRTDEATAIIKYEVYNRIKGMENMEIQPFDKEIFENYLKIKDIEPDYNFDSHDKQVFASAMTMECPLITSDQHLIRYNRRKKLIKSIIE